MANQQLKGTGVALITPFQENGMVDYSALQKLVDNLIREGVDFLVALGTTAETSTLSATEKQEVLTAIINFTANSIPLICGVGGNNTDEVVYELKTMDSVVLTTSLV
jgi:4-hydroxy-tetrahydrodipicolinate synthase